MVAFDTTPDTLTTTYLEMTGPHQFKPAFKPSDDVRIERMETIDTKFYRYLYRAVGEKWCWRDRLLLSAAELRDELNQPTTHIYVLYVGDEPAGYIELAKEGDAVEIAYFGLRGAYHGRGLGKHLLSYGVARAWDELDARRVWLHTCNLDSPYALANYQKRGFRVYMQHSEPMPERYQ